MPSAVVATSAFRRFSSSASLELDPPLAGLAE
jgi:hypothetical protein